MLGWVICKLKDNFEETNDISHGEHPSTTRIVNRVYDLVYGTLSDSLHPPTSNWVFLAKDSKLECVLQNLSVDLIQKVSETPIKLDILRINNDGYEYNNERYGEKIQGFQVENSPIESLNGIYLEEGLHEGACYYKHVRQWTILRCRLFEIPELGITPADSYGRNQGTDSNSFFEKAESAYHSIVDPMSNISEGSSEFTRKFIDIARAGNKLITADQTLKVLYDNERKSKYRTEKSNLLLTQIAQVDEPGNSNVLTKTIDENFELVFDSKITYQPGHMAAFDTKTSSETLAKLTTTLDYQFRFRPRNFNISNDLFLAEGELSVEVINTIEKREELLEMVVEKCKDLQKQYLSDGLTSISDDSLLDLQEKMNNLRETTIEFCEHYFSWARIAKKIQKQALLGNRQGIAKGPKFNTPLSVGREYAVVVAYHDTSELFGSSQAVKASVKRFSRGFEPPKRKVNLEYVGVFPTEKEAIDALEDAMRKIPEEQWFQEDLIPEKKVHVSLRPCKKHFLVFNNGHPKEPIPCEQCDALSLEKADFLPGYLYKKQNYNESVWNDLYNLVKDYDVLQYIKYRDILLQPDNPLLLPREILLFFLETSTKFSLSKNEEYNYKGKREQLHNALQFSHKYIYLTDLRERLKKYEHSPFNLQNNSKSNQDPDNLDSLRVSRSASSIVPLNPSINNRQTQTASGKQMKSGEINYELLQQAHLAAFDLNLTLHRISNAKHIIIKSLGSIGKMNKNESNDEKILNNDSNILEGKNNFSQTQMITKDNVNTTTQNPLMSKSLTLSKSAAAKKSEKDKKAMMASIVDPSRVMLQVEANYSDHGAEMVQVQNRYAPAYRTSEIFCRTDVGEWKGFPKGRAMRAYEFQEELYQKGKVREEERKNIQSIMRKLMQIKLVDCNPEYIAEVLRQAKGMKTSILNFDIAQAENYLLSYYKLVSSSVFAQAGYRRYREIKAYRQLQLAKKKAREHHKLLVKISQGFARECSPELLNNTQKKLSHKLLHRIKYKFIVNLSSFYCQVTIDQNIRKIRKPVDSLCKSCQTKEFFCDALPTDQPRVRAPCTCQNLQNMEEWHITFYFPLSCERIVLVLTVQEARKILLDLQQARDLLQSDRLQKIINGEPFREVYPLFKPYLKHQSKKKSSSSKSSSSIGQQSDSVYTFSNAWFIAARESAVLPRLPSPLPPAILTLLITSKDHDVPENPYFRISPSPKTLENFNSCQIMDNDPEMSWNWAPFHRLQSIHENIDLVDKEILYVKKINNNKEELLEVSKQQLAVLKEELEHKLITIEDERSALVQLNELCLVLANQNQQIMQYSKELSISVDLFESHKLLDDSRSYSDLERADLWKLMNQLSKSVKSSQAKEKDLFLKQQEILPLEIKINEKKQEITRLERTVVDFKEKIRNKRLSLMKYQQEYNILKMNLNTTLHNLVTTYSYPKKFSPVPGRYLQHIPYDLIFIRDPFQRLRKEYRKAMNGIYRQVCLITNIPSWISTTESNVIEDSNQESNKHLFNPEVDLPVGEYHQLRTLVSVFIDPNSRNMIIHLDGKGIQVEECCQHLDLGLEESAFSSILQYVQKNDIVLTPSDIQYILSRPLHPAKPKGLSPDPPFILPSERQRSIDHCSSLPSVQAIQKANSNSSYHLRLKNAEQEDVNLAKRLLEYLRLQPFTLRPCIGMLSHRRKSDFSNKLFQDSQFYSDLLSSTPLYLRHDLYFPMNIVYFTTLKGFYHVELRQHLNQFVLYLTPISETTQIKSQAILNFPFSRLKELFLSNYQHIFQTYILFQMMTVANYNQNTLIQLLLRYLQYSLPGMLSQQRSAFSSEFPVFRLPSYEHLKFNPENQNFYSCVRFLCGKFVFVQCYYDDSLDHKEFRFEISEPSKSSSEFILHAYRGPRLIIHVSLDELKIFVLSMSNSNQTSFVKKSIETKNTSNEYNFIHEDKLLNLFHPDTFPQLIHTFFDSLIYVEGLSDRVSYPVLQLEAGKRVLLAPRSSYFTKYLIIDLPKMKLFYKAFLDQYLNWVNKRYPSFKKDLSLTTEDIAKVYNNIDNLLRPPRWVIETRQIQSQSKYIPVFEGLWTFSTFEPISSLNLTPIFGETRSRLKVAIDLNKTLISLHADPIFLMPDEDEDITTVKSSDRRSILLLQDQLINEKESEMMGKEEEFSKKLNLFSNSSFSNVEKAKQDSNNFQKTLFESEFQKTFLFKEKLFLKDRITSDGFFQLHTQSTYYLLFQFLQILKVTQPLDYIPHAYHQYMQESKPLPDSMLMVFEKPSSFALQGFPLHETLISHHDYRQVDAWPRLNSAKENSLRNTQRISPFNLILSSDALKYLSLKSMVAMASIGDSKHYIIRQIAVAQYGVIGLNIVELTSQREFRICLLLSSEIIDSTQSKNTNESLEEMLLKAMKDITLHEIISEKITNHVNKIKLSFEKYIESLSHNNSPISVPKSRKSTSLFPSRKTKLQIDNSSNIIAPVVEEVPSKEKAYRRSSTAKRHSILAASLVNNNLIASLVQGDICFVYIPADEAEPYEYRRCQIGKIVQLIASYFKDSNQVDRFLTAQAIIFYRPSLQIEATKESNSLSFPQNIENIRLTKLLQTHLESNTNPDVKVLTKTILGPVLLLLRKPQESNDRIVQQLQVWQDEYYPMLLERQKKEGRVKEWKLDNHLAFIARLKPISLAILPFFEELTGCKKLSIQLSSQYTTLELFQLRSIAKLLIQWQVNKQPFHGKKDIDFLVLRNLITENSLLLDLFNHTLDPPQTTLEHPKAFLKDPCFITLETMLRELDQNQEPGVYKYEDLDSSLQNKYPEIFPFYSPAQILNGIFAEHCFHCQIPLSMCKFPLCGLIRGRARRFESHLEPIPELFSGNHPIDLALLELFTLREESSVVSKGYGQHHHRHHHVSRPRDMPPLSISTDEYLLDCSIKLTCERNLSIDEEIEEERKRDQEAQRIHDRKIELTLKWKETLAIAKEMEFLQQLLSSNELLASGFDAWDLLTIDGNVREYITKGKIIQTMKCLSNNSKNSDNSPVSKLPFVELMSVTKVQKKTKRSSHYITPLPTISFDASIALQVLEKVYDQDLSPSFDPYPVKIEGSSRFPMSASLFLNMMRKIHICKPSLTLKQNLISGTFTKDIRSNNTDDDVSVSSISSLSSPASTMCWDRLLYEGIVILSDHNHSIVIIQIFYGCWDNQALLITNNNAIPKAARRFVTIDELSTLSHGCTISIYDISSKMIRVKYISDDSLMQFGQFHNLQNANYCKLSKFIIQHALHIFTINRINGICIGFDLNLFFLIHKPEVELSKPPIDDMIQNINKGFSKIQMNSYVFNGTNHRMALLRKFMASNSSN